MLRGGQGGRRGAEGEVESISQHTNLLPSMFQLPEWRNIVHLPNLPLKSPLMRACNEGAAMEVLCRGVKTMAKCILARRLCVCVI